MSTPLIKFSQNSSRLLDSGKRPDIPAMTTSSILSFCQQNKNTHINFTVHVLGVNNPINNNNKLSHIKQTFVCVYFESRNFKTTKCLLGNKLKFFVDFLKAKVVTDIKLKTLVREGTTLEKKSNFLESKSLTGKLNR